MRILMVCLGNICRSPMAEGIMRNLAESRSMNIEVDSCGTAGYHIGSTPDPRSISTMSMHKMDISDLNARQFHRRDFWEFDLILTMDSSNFSDVLALSSSKEEADKVKMILNYTFPNESKPVPDPYYGSDNGFEHVYALLHEACSKILDEIQELD